MSTTFYAGQTDYINQLNNLWNLCGGIFSGWSNSANYVIGNVVSYNNSIYACIANNTNQAPPNATYWNALIVGPPTYVDKETPSGTINGSNATFTLAVAPNPASSCEGRLRSGGVGAFLPLIKDIDFTISGLTITMTTAPKTSSNLYFNSRH